MQFYLASRFENQKVLRGHRERIQDLGHTVQARWLDCESNRPRVGTPEWAAHCEHWQTIDLEDIESCDILISDQSCDMTNTTGGNFVEFGFALARHKDIWVIGKRPNAFFYNPDVEFYLNWDRVYRALGASEADTPAVTAVKSAMLYSLDANIEQFAREPADTMLQVPHVTVHSDLWTCADDDQRYADPGMKVLRRVHARR